MRPFGPVFSFEWRRNARRPRYLWLRGLYGGLLLVVLANFLAFEVPKTGWHLPATRVAPLAASYFWSFALIQLLAVLLATPVLTAGTIAEEKERGTLDHLLVTDLTAAELVLGKLAARLLLMLLLLLAGLPVLALTVWLGGTSAENLVAVTVLTVVMLSATLALSLWISLHARTGRESLQVIYTIGAVIGLFPPLFAFSPIPWPGGLIGAALRWIDECLTAPNPVVWLANAMQSGSPNWDRWWTVILANGTLSVVLAILAVVQIRQTARSHGAVLPAGLSRPMLWFLRPQLGRRPMFWKELFTRHPTRGLERLAFFAIASIGWGALMWMLWALVASPPNPAASTRTPFRIFANLVEPPLICIALLGVLVRSATCVSQERERGTWDSLLVTPLGPAEIVGAKLLGSLLCMRWIWLLVALLWLLGIAAGQLRPVFVIGAALLVTVLAFCTAAVGVFLSLSLRSSLRALSTGVALSLVLSGGYLLCALPLVVPTRASQEPPFMLLSPCIPFLLVSSMLLAIQDQTNSSLVVATCGLGGAWYAIAGLLLLVAVWRWFDQLAGRAN